jgi:hypothetical protein
MPGILQGTSSDTDFDGAGAAIYLACYGLVTGIEGLRRLADCSMHDLRFQSLVTRFDKMVPYRENPLNKG